MERSIWIYGNPDKSELGFPMPGDLTQYIKQDIFSKEQRRYRYTQGKNAEVIVLSRDGKAFGHLEVEDKIKPTDADRAAYPRVKFVYLIRASTLYYTPVPLATLSITKLRFGRKLSESEFQELLEQAGGVEEFHGIPLLPKSTVELERVLREVRLRLGQSEFRKEIIAAYNAQCAVSGCNAVEALEAAHIDPYSGVESNHPSNGLLLRADIHTLFDLNLIAIDPKNLTIVLDPCLKNSTYCDLEGKQLWKPQDAAARPNRQALVERWQRFVTK